MKVSQVLKLSAVVLALGSMPLHTAFAEEANEVRQAEGTEQNETGVSYGESEAQVEHHDAEPRDAEQRDGDQAE